MGIHFLLDILCGAAIGTLMVLASQRLPISRVAFKIPATFGADLRSLPA